MGGCRVHIQAERSGPSVCLVLLRSVKSSTSLPHSDAKAPLNKGGASSGNTCLPVSPASLPSSLSEGVHPVLGVQDTRAICRYLPTC